MMLCVVTGGAGFIGSHLVDALVARGDRVIVIDSLVNGDRRNIADHIDTGRLTFVQADLLRDGWQDVLTGADESIPPCSGPGCTPGFADTGQPDS